MFGTGGAGAGHAPAQERRPDPQVAERQAALAAAQDVAGHVIHGGTGAKTLDKPGEAR